MAARSGFNTRFLIIPCCFHDLSGSRVTSYDADMGRYASYVKDVESMCRACGYEPERESLRIPSTKNIAIVGRKRLIAQDVDINSTLNQIIEGVCFVPRKSDREKNAIRLAKKSHQSDSNTELDTFDLNEFSQLDLEEEHH